MYWPCSALWYTLVLILASVDASAPHARLSHEGLYLNLASEPSLVVYLNPIALQVDNATVQISALRLRTKAEIALCSNASSHPFEVCEKEDVESNILNSTQYLLDKTQQQPDWGITLVPSADKSSNPLAQLVDHRLGYGLRSIVITLRTRHGDLVRKRSWWLANLVSKRAVWPIAVSDTVSRIGEPKSIDQKTEWTGGAVRISGVMQDPFIYRSSQQSYWQNSSWSKSITIRTRTGDPPPLVHSPVDGTIVWSAPFRHTLFPTTGPDAGLNDDLDWCIMVQDAWNTVYQLYGIERGSAKVKAGDHVKIGEVIGNTLREPISEMPPITTPPTDPPANYALQGFAPFPYRFRKLIIRVARTSCHIPGDRCFSPAARWTYYPPQFVLAARKAPSCLPPLLEPNRIYFAPASRTPLQHIPLAAPHRAAVHPLPLSGRVDIFTTFPSFDTTLDDLDDAFDPIAAHKIEWAAVPSTNDSLCYNRTVYWRRSSEHTRLPAARDASLEDPSFVLAHYAPLVVVASVAGHAFRAQLISQFDEKERALVYAVSRTHLGAADVNGAWEIEHEPSRGLYQVAIVAVQRPECF
ncbi:hypothetical protein MPSI1_000774 [Malassezia psittaci]|uniref:Peptidase M23 domain-containing protein n=1 Tax=Malassezia psittaci TaxID=1821823 RepID=A0AAF0JD80_9BASI|nr:hypothetical protein MPSI1_000774 [Malassezia psittaci]